MKKYILIPLLLLAISCGKQSTSPIVSSSVESLSSTLRPTGTINCVCTDPSVSKYHVKVSLENLTGDEVCTLQLKIDGFPLIVEPLEDSNGVQFTKLSYRINGNDHCGEGIMKLKVDGITVSTAVDPFLSCSHLCTGGGCPEPDPRAPTAHIFTACKVNVDTHRVIFTCTKAIVNNLHLNVYDTITHQQYVSLAITQNGEQSKEFVFGESGYVSTCVYKIETSTQVLDRMKDKGEICNP